MSDSNAIAIITPEWRSVISIVRTPKTIVKTANIMLTIKPNCQIGKSGVSCKI